MSDVDYKVLSHEEMLAVLVSYVQARGEDVQPDEVTDDAVLEDLGVDSNKTVALIGDLEETLGFRVPDEARKGELPKTVGELVERVMLRVRENAA